MNLKAAMLAFVATGCDRGKMDVSEWAKTYHATGEEVRAAWEAAATVHSRQQHHNGEEVE